MTNEQQTTTKNQMPAGRAFEEITDKEVTLAQEMGIDLGVSINERMDRVVTKTNTAMRLIVESGLDLISIKSECGHGEFGKILRDRDVSSQRASEMMTMARFSAQLPTSDRKKILSLPKKKALVLAKADPEVIDVVLNDDEVFDELSTKSVRELQQEVRRLKADLAQKETEKDTADNHTKKLQALLDMRREDSDYPDFYLIVREESRAMATQSELCLEQLAALYNDELQRLQQPSNSDDVNHYTDRGLATLYVHANSMAARFSDLAKKMVRELPERITDKLGDNISYTSFEVSAAIERHELMMAEFNNAIASRADAREAAKPKGRGRPKKAKAKGTGA